MSPKYGIPDKIITNETNQLVNADREVFETFGIVDFQRTRFWCLAAAVAIDTPRRVGPDADNRELAIDRRISRKMRGSYATLWGIFHSNDMAPPPPVWSNRSELVHDPITARIGATVIWEQQVNYLINVVVRRMTLLNEFRYLAEMNKMKKWYNKQGMFLDWELEALHRVSQFIEETKSPDFRIAGSTLQMQD